MSCRAANHEAARQQHHHLREQAGLCFLHPLIAASDICTAAVSYVEVLGYHLLTPVEMQLLEEFFANTPTLPVSAPVLDQAVQLRRRRRMKLGDALVAATALTPGCELVTRNTADFDWVTGLSLHDPFASAKSS